MKTKIDTVIKLKDISVELAEKLHKKHIKKYGKHSSNLEQVLGEIKNTVENGEDSEDDLLEYIQYQVSQI